jgi:tetratricopeptide (TPR) repeat protein
MTNSFKHSASIEQFLADEMAPAERTAFTNELRANPELAQELKLSQSIDSAIIQDDVIDLRKKLISAINSGRDAQQEVPVVRMHARKWWYAAASFLVLCAVASTLYLQNTRNVSTDSLFSQYYSSENIVDLTRGDENIVDAVVKFQQKDYEKASASFGRILEKDNSNIAVWFYYGIANIETRNYDKSIEAFNTIIKDNDNLYIEHAEWYLGLCYLKAGQKDKAIEQFATVASDSDNFHNQEAKNILEKLQLK